MQRTKMVQREILLLPIGKVLVDILEEIAVALRKLYGVHVRIGRPEEPETTSYLDERRQFDAGRLLNMAIGRKRESLLAVLGVVDADMFSGEKNFVFGMHAREHASAVVALARLREEFYKKNSKRELFLRRAVTESMFQVGRSLGLGCQHKKCIMQDTTSLWRLDEKEQKFCPECATRVSEAVQVRPQVKREAREDAEVKHEGPDAETVVMPNLKAVHPVPDDETEIASQILEPEGPMPAELAAIHPEAEGPEEPLIADRNARHP